MIPAKGHRPSHRGRPWAALAFLLFCSPSFADAPQDLLAAGTRAFASGKLRGGRRQLPAHRDRLPRVRRPRRKRVTFSGCPCSRPVSGRCDHRAHLVRGTFSPLLPRSAVRPLARGSKRCPGPVFPGSRVPDKRAFPGRGRGSVERRRGPRYRESIRGPGTAAGRLLVVPKGSGGSLGRCAGRGGRVQAGQRTDALRGLRQRPRLPGEGGAHRVEHAVRGGGPVLPCRV